MIQNENEIILNKIKKTISSELLNKRYEVALRLISCAANILYQGNISYRDDALEDFVSDVSSGLDYEITDYHADENTVLFWDGFGLDNCGLAQIYLKALGEIKHVVYVTYSDCQDKLNNTKSILMESGGDFVCVERDSRSKLSTIKALSEVINKYTPGHYFNYSNSYDVISPVIMHIYNGRFIRYQINLTDNAFWLGAKCIDKCIEFRDYGAIISNKYRRIDKTQIVEIPFYPIINDIEFQGYPISFKDSQKIVFSSGTLYKTLGGDNQYYYIIDRLLNENQDVVFWYAGSGDSIQIDKLSEKYHGRVIHTSERKDLIEVIKRSRAYLTTYPLCEGLTLQYAAVSGRVPLTLSNGDATDDFLINQKNINVEFSDIDSLLLELNKLLRDDDYWKTRAGEMKKAVIEPTVFNGEVKKLFDKEIESLYPINYRNIETKNIRKWFLYKKNFGDIQQLLIRQNTIITGFRHYPLEIVGDGYEYYQEKDKEVSVVVATYNPSLQGYIDTIDSIHKQKEIKYEIVITDDGSQDSKIADIIIHMEKIGETDYKILLHSENQGTVSNYCDGLCLADGKYIKLISPGDCFLDENVLYHWVSEIKSSNKKWSFGDVKYYRSVDGKNQIFVDKARPQITACYLKGRDKTCIWNYCVLDDIAIGAATLCEKNLMTKYMRKIEGKVRFAEDNIYRMMMFEGIVPLYYPHSVILYEYGSGISTSKESPMKKRMRNDWKMTNSIIIDLQDNLDGLQTSIINKLKKHTEGNKTRTSRLLDKGWISLRIKNKFFYRKTEL